MVCPMSATLPLAPRDPTIGSHYPGSQVVLKFCRRSAHAHVCGLGRTVTRQHEAHPLALVNHHDFEPGLPPVHGDEWRVMAGEAGVGITAVWVLGRKVRVIFVVGDCAVVYGGLPNQSL